MFIFLGVAVGGGWQGLVAYINLGCYYIFGLPFGYLLGYIANFGVMVREFRKWHELSQLMLKLKLMYNVFRDFGLE